MNHVATSLDIDLESKQTTNKSQIELQSTGQSSTDVKTAKQFVVGHRVAMPTDSTGNFEREAFLKSAERSHHIPAETVTDESWESELEIDGLRPEKLFSLSNEYGDKKNAPRSDEENKEGLRMLALYLKAAERGHSGAMVILALHYLENDHLKAIKYLQMAIEKDDVNAMKLMACQYEEKKDESNLKKYYLMAIERGDEDAMDLLGCYFRDHQDYPNMLKYWLMAIDKGWVAAMIDLGIHYLKNSDHPNYVKYFTMAAEKGDVIAMTGLGYYYQNCCTVEKLAHEPNMIKYYTMAIEHGDLPSIQSLAKYYEKKGDYPTMIKYYVMMIEKGTMTVSDLTRIAIYTSRSQLFPIQLKDCMEQCFEALTHMLETTTNGELYKTILSECTDILCNKDNIPYNNRMMTHKVLDERIKLHKRIQELEQSIKEKDDTIQELRLMPEGPEYAAAKQRFQVNAQRL